MPGLSGTRDLPVTQCCTWKEVLDTAVLGKFVRQLDWKSIFSLFLQELSEPVGQHAICYFLLLKVGLCAEEPVMSEPFLVMYSLRPGVKEHLIQNPLGRRCLPTSLSILSCSSCWQAAAVASLHNLLGGYGWGIHECKSYGSFHPWIYTLSLATLQERERKWAFMEYMLYLRHCVRPFTYYNRNLLSIYCEACTVLGAAHKPDMVPSLMYSTQ